MRQIFSETHDLPLSHRLHGIAVPRIVYTSDHRRDEIALATLADVPGMLAVLQDFAGNNNAVTDDAFKSRINRPLQGYLCARGPQGVNGYMAFDLASLERESTVEMTHIVVSEKHKKTGTRLVDGFFELSQQLGAKTVEVMSALPQGLGLLHALGFDVHRASARKDVAAYMAQRNRVS